jgi:hypothetical protein
MPHNKKNPCCLDDFQTSPISGISPDFSDRAGAGQCGHRADGQRQRNRALSGSSLKKASMVPECLPFPQQILISSVRFLAI